MHEHSHKMEIEYRTNKFALSKINDFIHFFVCACVYVFYALAFEWQKHDLNWLGIERSFRSECVLRTETMANGSCGLHDVHDSSTCMHRSCAYPKQITLQINYRSIK